MDYDAAVAAFELDLAFAPEEVASGLERLFVRRALPWSRRAGSARCYEFKTALASGAEAVVSVAPMPPERQAYPSFFPRALVQAQAPDPADLEALRRDIILTFLRIMG